MVEIKPFDLQNVTVHYKWNNDPELTYYDSEYPHEHESFDTFLKRIKAVVDERNETAELFEIHLEENNKLIGIVDIHAIDTYNRRCFVNCTIGDREYAEKGYDIAAMKIILAHCFNEKNMHKVATTAFDFNTTWIEHVKKLGFSKEGELREHVIKKDKFINKLIFSILEDEYKEQSSSEEDKAIHA
ncbi:MAG: GNAT family protein [Balneolaceae bacterium]|nr:GNAT family protein [Balneolaceae bacterium]